MDNSYGNGLAPPPWVDKGGVRYDSILEMIEEKKAILEKANNKSDPHMLLFGSNSPDRASLPGGQGSAMNIPAQQVQALRNIFGVDQ